MSRNWKVILVILAVFVVIVAATAACTFLGYSEGGGSQVPPTMKARTP